MRKILVILITVAAVTFFANTISAANASNFNPSRIIDDAIFYNANAMDTSQIQGFLNSKVPTCDTNGSEKATEWGRPDLTRAQFATQVMGWHGPPYTCLRDYRQNTPQMEAASGLCLSMPAGTSRSSAQIINDVAKACGINPQVLLVLLDKEQSLVMDIWPLKSQYRNATGFACPDTAPCNPDYEGFFYQVYHAARQFKVYQARPNDYNYIAGRTNRIYWQTNLGSYINPSGNADDPSRINNNFSSCGYQNVFIENQATAALYIYTPYQPNRNALGNLYGTGDACSAYGNRNFWRLFTDWFGNTQGRTLMSELGGRYTALGGFNGILGIPVDNGFCNSDRSVCWQQFKNGFIIYSKKSGAWESKGSIRNYWAKTGYQGGKMGFPVDAEVYAGNGLWWQQYQNGFIIGSTKTGFWESMGPTRERWGQLGYQNSMLGLPVDTVVVNKDGSGWQQYQNGFIIGSTKTGFWESKGAIRAYWRSIGYQSGKAGWPTGPEVYNTSTKTWSQGYEKGTIFYSDTHGGSFTDSASESPSTAEAEPSIDTAG